MKRRKSFAITKWRDSKKVPVPLFTVKKSRPDWSGRLFHFTNLEYLLDSPTDYYLLIHNLA